MANFSADQQAALSDTANALQQAIILVGHLTTTQRTALADVETVARELSRGAAALARLRGDGKEDRR